MPQQSARPHCMSATITRCINATISPPAAASASLIASGAYTSGLLAGLLSEGFGDESADGKGHVGVDYKVRFIAPVRVDRLMSFEWTVADLEPRRSGTLARLEGCIVDTTSGTVAVSAEMMLLYFA